MLISNSSCIVFICKKTRDFFSWTLFSPAISSRPIQSESHHAQLVSHCQKKRFSVRQLTTVVIVDLTPPSQWRCIMTEGFQRPQREDCSDTNGLCRLDTGSLDHVMCLSSEACICRTVLCAAQTPLLHLTENSTGAVEIYTYTEMHQLIQCRASKIRH